MEKNEVGIVGNSPLGAWARDRGIAWPLADRQAEDAGSEHPGLVIVHLSWGSASRAKTPVPLAGVDLGLSPAYAALREAMPFWSAEEARNALFSGHAWEESMARLMLIACARDMGLFAEHSTPTKEWMEAAKFAINQLRMDMADLRPKKVRELSPAENGAPTVFVAVHSFPFQVGLPVPGPDSQELVAGAFVRTDDSFADRMGRPVMEAMAQAVGLIVGPEAVIWSAFLPSSELGTPLVRAAWERRQLERAAAEGDAASRAGGFGSGAEEAAEKAKRTPRSL